MNYSVFNVNFKTRYQGTILGGVTLKPILDIKDKIIVQPYILLN